MFPFATCGRNLGVTKRAKDGVCEVCNGARNIGSIDAPVVAQLTAHTPMFSFSWTLVSLGLDSPQISIPD